MLNKIQQHIQEIENFQIPEVSRENKIYFLEVKEKPFPKVGDTIRDVEERNRETMTNAALHRKEGTEPFYVLAQKHDGTTFRDKQFHAFLRKQGYKFELNDQGNESEWVESDPNGNIPTVPQLLLELEKFTAKPVFKSVELRTAQHYVLTQLQQAIEDGYEGVNLGACVRIGKTLISLTHAANNGWMPVYIGKNLTSQSSAETDNNEFGVVPELVTISLHGIDELDDTQASKKVKQIIQKIDATNVSNRKLMFVVDEVDDASHTKKSRDILVPVIKHYMQKKQHGQTICMSGTRIYRGEKILNQLGIRYTSSSIEYYEMQRLQPETTCRRNYRHISFYSEDTDGLANISDSMKNKDNGHKSLATVVAKLLGTNNFQFTTDPRFPHWFIKFATVGKTNANAFVRYLNRNHSTVESQDYVYVAINGDVTSAKEAQSYCKEAIKSNPGKVCVFISQGMATTSFSVTAIGNSAVFTDNELTADDDQALHRSATWAEGKEECNMLVITTNNSMEHTFDDIFEDEAKLASNREETIEIYREFLNNNSMVHFTVDGNSVRPVQVTPANVDKVIDKKQRVMTKIASLMNVVNDMDEDVVDKILTSDHGYKKPSSTSEFSASLTGDAFDPFGGDDDKEPSQKKVVDPNKITLKKREQIMRAFVEMAVMVPAVAREQGVTLETFDYWEELNISKELFEEVYTKSWVFKDRIDAIYSLCEDEEHLINNYISKLVA